jgi:hypothetical protein
MSLAGLSLPRLGLLGVALGFALVGGCRCKEETLAPVVFDQGGGDDVVDPTKVLASGVSSGSSQLFVSSNLQTARNNALPEALERAGEALVSKLANGY